MANDQQTYKRGAGAALFGLGTQIALFVATIIVGIYAGSGAFYAAAFHAFAGIFIWAILLVIFNQHRLERAEALEAEQLAASDANMAALFDEHEENLRVARRRLDRLYKWGLGIVSCVTGLYLLITGLILLHQLYWVYSQGSDPVITRGILSISHDLIRPGATPGLLLVFSLGLTLASFIVARYEAGMTKIQEWQMLRGGAAFLVGSALIYGLLAVGLAAKLFGNDMALGIVTQAVPVIMIVLGTETLLVFMLNAYRPRRPGEIPRPAFDSRLLGMMTSPTSLAKAIGDALNYQFGFEVSQSWFFQLLTKWIGVLVAVGVLVLWAISALIIVEPHEQAILLRGGNTIQTGEMLKPGLHVRAPWPFRTVVKRNVSRIQQIFVSSSEKFIGPDRPVLWDSEPEQEATPDRYFITRPAARRGDDAMAGAEAAAGAVALFNAQANIQWRVDDLREYLSAAERPDMLLQMLCEDIINEYFMRQDIDTVIGKGRAAMSAELRQLIQTRVDAAGRRGASMGVRIVFVGVNAVRPPTEGAVARSFENEVGAIQEAQMAIDGARRDAAQTLARVAGTVERVDALVAKVNALRAVGDELDQLRRDGADEAAIEAKETELRLAELDAEDAIISSSQGKAAELLLQSRAESWQRLLSERGKSVRYQAQLAAFEMRQATTACADISKCSAAAWLRSESSSSAWAMRAVWASRST